VKTIPAQLLSHKAQSSTTLADLLLVGPLPDASYRGFAGLDIDVAYDNGAGSRTYKARTGMQMSAMQSSADLGVDNAEAETLLPIAGYEIEGFTQAQIDAGALDKVPFVVYRVNYNDLTAGRHEVMGSGTIGEMRQKFGGLTILELRSLSQQLKQSIVELDSINCRARFGSQVGDERFPCGYDLTAEWISGTVTGVGSEADRTFSCSTLAQSTDYFAPGLVEWLSGDNLGQECEVEAFASAVVDLQFPTVNAVSIGDTFRIRRDCTKRFSGHNSCETFWAADKTLHFRGEPHIPIGDTGKLNSPGAAIASNIGGTGESV
jgi:uncharacterized phage protein (TIGR02218 family)